MGGLCKCWVGGWYVGEGCGVKGWLAVCLHTMLSAVAGLLPTCNAATSSFSFLSLPPPRRPLCTCRATTVYLVQRRIDMLPKPLTEDICSLR